MAREVCLIPCIPITKSVPQITVPLMGSTLQAAGTLSFEGGCNGCELVASLMLQIGPLFAAMGIPICLLGCVGAVIAAIKTIPDILGPPPNPSGLLQALADVAVECECVIGFTLPPPVGVVCDFIKMFRDLLSVLDSIVACVIALVTHLLTLNLKASLMASSLSFDTRQAGSCLLLQVLALMDVLNAKLAGLATIFGLIQKIISFIGSVVPPPFTSIMTTLVSGFNLFTSSTPIGTPPGSFLTELMTFKASVDTAVSAFTAVANLCP